MREYERSERHRRHLNIAGHELLLLLLMMLRAVFVTCAVHGRTARYCLKMRHWELVATARSLLPQHGIHVF
jgi:hypothetical protein